MDREGRDSRPASEARGSGRVDGDGAAFGLAPGAHVADLGRGSGALLTGMAERVGPTGRVVGVDRDARLLAVARERTAVFPWVKTFEDDATAYDTGGAQFDAVHCRLVLIHQRHLPALVARMVALARPGDRVAAQEVDADGPIGSPGVACLPPFPALERLGTACLTASLRRGSDTHGGRKVLDRFGRAGLTNLRVEAQAAFCPVTDPHATIMLDLFGRLGRGRRGRVVRRAARRGVRRAAGRGAAGTQ